MQRRRMSRCMPRGVSAPDPGAPPGSRCTTLRPIVQPTRLLWRPASGCRSAADRSASGAAPTRTATSSSGVPTPSVATAASVAGWRRSRSGGRRRRGARLLDHGAACTTRRRRPRRTSPRAPRASVLADGSGEVPNGERVGWLALWYISQTAVIGAARDPKEAAEGGTVVGRISALESKPEGSHLWVI